MDRNQAAPLLFTAWLDQLTRAIFADELGTAFDGFALWNAEQVAHVLGEGQAWCDDVTTPVATETCHDQLRLSLGRALDALAARLGDDIDRWRWGDLHRARFSHPLLGHLPVVRRMTDLAIETDGDNYTVNRASPRPRGEPLFEAIHGAGLRAVFDLADLDRSRFVVATGQSGHPLSSHYGDLLGRWRDGGFVTIVGTDRPGVRRLVLEPARPEARAQ
jgi:penicillin amidase